MSRWNYWTKALIHVKKENNILNYVNLLNKLPLNPSKKDIYEHNLYKQVEKKCNEYEIEENKKKLNKKY